MGRRVKHNSIANIASEVGVSAFAVSCVINNRPGVSAATRQKIQKVLEQVDYRRNYKLSTGRTVGLVSFGFRDDWYMSALVQGMLTYSAESDCNIATIIHQPESGKSLEEALRIHNCDAAIVAMGCHMIPAIEKLSVCTNIPIILMDKDLNGITFEGDVSDRIGCVVNNSYQGSVEMCQYLIGLKHRRIAFITRHHDQPDENQEARIKGWKDVMSQSGMNESEIRDLSFKGVTGDIGEIDFKAKGISAVMCVDDMMAMACLRYCYEQHIHIPEELTVTGFGNMRLCADMSPPLTSVDQKTQEVGYSAARYAHELASGRRTEAPRIVIPTELVIRKSSAEAR